MVWDTGKQVSCVIMLWFLIDKFCWSCFNDFTVIHDNYDVTDVFHHSKIVSDE